MSVSKYHHRVAVVLLCLSTTTNFFLLRAVSSLKARLRVASGAARYNVQLAQHKAGDLVPDLFARSLDGSQIRIDFSKVKPTVLYVFSLACSWCRQNKQSINDLAALIGSKYNIIGVCIREPDQTVISRSEYEFRVVRDPDAATVGAFRFGATPQTLVIGADGRIQQIWNGAFTGEVLRSIESFFGIRLATRAPHDFLSGGSA